MPPIPPVVPPAGPPAVPPAGPPAAPPAARTGMPVWLVAVTIFICAVAAIVGIFLVVHWLSPSSTEKIAEEEKIITKDDKKELSKLKEELASIKKEEEKKLLQFINEELKSKEQRLAESSVQLQKERSERISDLKEDKKEEKEERRKKEELLSKSKDEQISDLRRWVANLEAALKEAKTPPKPPPEEKEKNVLPKETLEKIESILEDARRQHKDVVEATIRQHNELTANLSPQKLLEAKEKLLEQIGEWNRQFEEKIERERRRLIEREKERLKHR